MSTGSKSHRGKSGRPKEVKNAGNALWDDVILLLILAFCIYLYLCFFSFTGKLGVAIKGFLFGMFGMLTFIVPALLFFASAFYLSNRGRRVAWVKAGAAAVLLCNLCAAAALLFSPDIVKLNAKEYYARCQTDPVSGGFLGCFLAGILKSMIGEIATWVLIVVMIIIAIVLITEKSFFKGVKHGSERIYHTARADADRRKVRREERRLERVQMQREYEERLRNEQGNRVLRTEKKVSGVMLNTNLKPPETQTDEIHEITRPDQETSEEWKNQHAINFSEAQEFVDDYNDELFSDRHRKTAESDEKKPANLPVDQKNSGKDTANQTKRPVTAKKISRAASDGYAYPPIDLLEKGQPISGDSTQKLNDTAQLLQETLHTFGVEVSLKSISQGPTVTQYELEPEPGVKVSKIVGLADDIKLRMAATDIRIEAPIPGKAAVGIEIPNEKNATVMLRDLIESETFENASSKIGFAVGMDLGGNVIVADIAKMPHMLIAGATGSGKSVCINTLIISILYKASPEEVKLIMIDPKVVELSGYNGIPHLLVPVVTDPRKAAAALNWGVNEMTERYNKFAELGVRDLKGYNKKVETLLTPDASDEEKEKYAKLPQIVIIVDELADLMMVASNEVEDSICRLAQLARAAGIHLIIATQRPSVDVITGLIKANMPSRVAFSVSSSVDSRTILDMNGAERLLGKGDMLFYPQGLPKPTRIQGAFVSDGEVQRVVEYLKEQGGGSAYHSEIADKIAAASAQGTASDSSLGDSGRDELYVDAGRFVIETDKASIGNLQRKFKIGFNRAARIMDQLAEDAVVSQSEGTKPRQVLMGMEQFEQWIETDV